MTRQEIAKLRTLVRAAGYAPNSAYRSAKTKEALAIIDNIEQHIRASCLSPLEQRAKDFDYDYREGD